MLEGLKQYLKKKKYLEDYSKALSTKPKTPPKIVRIEEEEKIMNQ